MRHLVCALVPSIVYNFKFNTHFSFCENKISDVKQNKSKGTQECPDTVCKSKKSMLSAAMQHFEKEKIEREINKPTTSPKKDECPLDREELGVKTWGLLHTLAAYFPEKPSPSQESYAHVLLMSFAQLYPCHICADDFQTFVEQYPPRTGSRESFVVWMCDLHNSVNEKLGKPRTLCNIKSLDERWKYGTSDCIQSQVQDDSKNKLQ